VSTSVGRSEAGLSIAFPSPGTNAAHQAPLITGRFCGRRASSAHRSLCKSLAKTHPCARSLICRRLAHAAVGATPDIGMIQQFWFLKTVLTNSPTLGAQMGLRVADRMNAEESFSKADKTAPMVGWVWRSRAKEEKPRASQKRASAGPNQRSDRGAPRRRVLLSYSLSFLRSQASTILLGSTASLSIDSSTTLPFLSIRNVARRALFTVTPPTG
jgi:hypothetical protein